MVGELAKVYFNHIPKTGGTFLIHNILKSLKDINFNFSLYTMGDRGISIKEDIVGSDLIMGHLGIEPNLYLHELETFTIIRNPIDRVISNYLMVYDDIKQSSISHFNTWIFNDDVGYLTKNNLQSRFLTTERRKDLEETFFVNSYANNYSQMMKGHRLVQENGFGINNYPVKYEIAKAYLNKCSFVLQTESLQNEINKVFDLIDSKWNIKTKRPSTNKKKQKSSDFKKLLNKKQINKIISLNDVDMKIWEYAKTLS